MNKKRIEIIVEIERLESRKISFQNVLKDVNDFYCKSTGIRVVLDSTSHNKEYDDRTIKVNDTIFKEYLQNEIETLEIRISKAIGDLK